jgi:hypothetical protein
VDLIFSQINEYFVSIPSDSYCVNPPRFLLLTLDMDLIFSQINEYFVSIPSDSYF